VPGVGCQEFGIRKLECGMWKKRKGVGRIQTIEADTFRTRPRACPRELEFFKGRVQRRRRQLPWRSSRAGLRASRIQFIAHSRIWPAQRPTLPTFLHEIDIEFYEVSYEELKTNQLFNQSTIIHNQNQQGDKHGNRKQNCQNI